MESSDSSSLFRLARSRCLSIAKMISKDSTSADSRGAFIGYSRSTWSPGLLYRWMDHIEDHFSRIDAIWLEAGVKVLILDLPFAFNKAEYELHRSHCHNYSSLEWTVWHQLSCMEDPQLEQFDVFLVNLIELLDAEGHEFLIKLLSSPKMTHLQTLIFSTDGRHTYSKYYERRAGNLYLNVF